MNLPDELKSFAAAFELALPTTIELSRMVAEEAEVWAMRGDKNKVRAETASVTAMVNNLGGLQRLKHWLSERKLAFKNRQAIDKPRGLMLLGVQGGGKSLAAKAVAGAWQVPLLRFDFGVLYNKFFGETERNIRQAFATATVMAPCVLWCDEIEKGIATGDNDNGTSKRVLGTLLTWMAEYDAPVCLVATANNNRSRRCVGGR